MTKVLILSSETKAHSWSDGFIRFKNQLQHADHSFLCSSHLHIDIHDPLKIKMEFNSVSINKEKESLSESPLSTNKNQTQYLQKPNLINTSTLFSNYQDYDLILPRFGYASKKYGLYVLKQLELLSIPCINSSRCIEMTKDKFELAQLLFQNKIPIPAQSLCHNSTESHWHLLSKELNSIEQDSVPNLQNQKEVIKLLDGSQGFGINLCRDLDSNLALSDTLRSLQTLALHQQYIPAQKEYRVLFINDQTWTIEKTGPDFRKNLHQNKNEINSFKYLTDTPKPIHELIMKIKNCIPGFYYGGIDLLLTLDTEELLVIDVNSSPGWKAFQNLVPNINLEDFFLSSLSPQIRNNNNNNNNNNTTYKNK